MFYINYGYKGLKNFRAKALIECLLTNPRLKPGVNDAAVLMVFSEPQA
jgi:hypothetical protein